MNVFIVDDDDAMADYAELSIREAVPESRVRKFESMLDAASQSARCDLLVTDISALCGHILHSHAAYAPICSFLDRRPHCPIVICSAVGTVVAEEVIEDVKRVHPDAVLYAADFVRAKSLTTIVRRITGQTQPQE